MRIRVEVDMAGFNQMEKRIQKQLPFATANAINEVTKGSQKVQREHNRKVFRVRRPTFVDRSVKITHWAKKYAGKFFSEIGIVSPGNASDILGKFEEGGIKRPRGKSLTIPDSVKRSKADIVTKANRPKAYNFKLHGKGSKATVFKGDKRVFMIQRADGSGGIYQRYGAKRSMTPRGSGRRGRSSVTRKLFALTPDALIDRRLNFVENVTKVVRTKFKGEFDKAWEMALRTMR